MDLTILLIVSSFALCAAFTPAFRRLAIRKNWVDRPDNRRKMHKIPIARIGGAPIILAYCVALGACLLSGVNVTNTEDFSSPTIWALLAPAALVFAIGLLDDIVGLKPWQKLVGETVAAVIVYLGGIHITGIGGHLFGNAVAFVITVVWLVACTNAFNLIDGLDGLAAGIGLIASLTSLSLGLARGDTGLVLATAPLIGALLAFLFFNFDPATIFLGDSGSLWIGFMLAGYGVIWCQKSVTALSITAPIMTLCIPLLDTALSIGRRFLRGEPIFRADRGHIHHRLLDRGFAPRLVTLVLYGASSIGAIFSLLQSSASNSVRTAVMCAFCIIVYFGIHNLGYQEFGVVARLLRRKTIRSLVKTHFSLCEYETLLKAVRTVDECWDILKTAANELGFSEIELQLAGRRYKEQLRQSANASWSFEVPLSDSEYVRFLCHFEFGAKFTHVAPWADVLHRCLGARILSAAVEGEPTPPFSSVELKRV